MLVKVLPGQSYFCTLYELNVPGEINVIVDRMSEDPVSGYLLHIWLQTQ